ncbi:MAG: hypothetical protein M1335_02180 [Chloroflexi bacterium]|nr:hypothetical protein [Chloroflexota bacterium]
MDESSYPLRVIFSGARNWDGVPMDGVEVCGPFHRPGMLWRWANRECYLINYRGWRDDINPVIRENSSHGWRAIKVALDEWAMNDLIEADHGDGSRVHILQGDHAWHEWLCAEEEADAECAKLPPRGFCPVGPVCSCGCEDWPCCVHADDYIYATD